MANYTLRQLKYFVTTVKCGTVAEASRQLFIAQPSISAAIKGLEESFNMQLFIRQHAQGMYLTQAGQRFYEKAQALLQSAHAFEQNAMADNEMVNGQIDIGWATPPFQLDELRRGDIRVIARASEVPDLRKETVRVQIANAATVSGKAEMIAL